MDQKIRVTHLSLLNKVQKNIDILTFSVSFFVSIFVLLYLFKYWFAVYVVLFFFSIWGIFNVPASWKKVRSGVIAYFSGYIISAILGFLFVTVI